MNFISETHPNNKQKPSWSSSRMIKDQDRNLEFWQLVGKLESKWIRFLRFGTKVFYLENMAAPSRNGVTILTTRIWPVKPTLIGQTNARRRIYRLLITQFMDAIAKTLNFRLFNCHLHPWVITKGNFFGVEVRLRIYVKTFLVVNNRITTCYKEVKK